MSFIVKNTTFCGLFDLICPHSCRGCGAIGEPVCECCKNDICAEHLDFCPNCKGPVRNFFCEECYLPPIFTIGRRDQLIGKLVSDLKYQQKRKLASDLVELMDRIFPVLAGPVMVVPLPTIRRHIRERGFDHTLLIAKKFAKRRGFKVGRILVRTNDTVQVGANAETRQRQAKQAYAINGAIDKSSTYLLLDDVWTTGASMKAAIKKLRMAGAFKIVGAVLAVSRLNH